MQVFTEEQRPYILCLQLFLIMIISELSHIACFRWESLCLCYNLQSIIQGTALFYKSC